MNTLIDSPDKSHLRIAAEIFELMKEIYQLSDVNIHAVLQILVYYDSVLNNNSIIKTL